MAEIRYKLDNLGWYHFEWLCQSLLKSSLGVAVEAWGGHSDLGRDAFCSEDLEITKGTKSPGPFVFQVKFVAEANAAGARPDNLLKNAFRKELSSINIRKQRNSWLPLKYYILITNAQPSSETKLYIESTFSELVPDCRVKVWGGQDICAMLDDNPNIRVAFPQILGIADLKILLQSTVVKPIIERSTLLIDRAKELTEVFVPTKAYNHALQILNEYGFVVLTGPPEMGKTAIATVIGFAKFCTGWECFEIRKPEEILRMDEETKRQIFIADDAFGSTEFNLENTRLWEGDIHNTLRKVNKNHWLIWTSRPAPLKLAIEKMNLQDCAIEFPKPGEVLVDVADLSIEEKAMMLYRHAKAASLGSQEKIIIKTRAKHIVNHKHFTPERIRRFVTNHIKQIADNNYVGTKINELITEAVQQEIEQPTKKMRTSFEALQPKYQDLLLAMLDCSSGTVSGVKLYEAYERIVGAELDDNPEKVATILSDHFLRCVDQ